MVDLVAHLLLLPRLQESHGEVDALQLTVGDGEVTGPGRSQAQQHCIKLFLEVLWGGKKEGHDEEM